MSEIPPRLSEKKTINFLIKYFNMMKKRFYRFYKWEESECLIIGVFKMP